MNNRKIDFKSVLTKEDIAKISPEELAIIEKDAREQGKILRAKYEGSKLLEVLSSKPREKANSIKYQGLSSQAKELFASTVAFPSYSTIIKILIEYNINYIQAYTISRAVSNVKNIMTKQTQLINDTNTKIAIIKLNSICEIFYREFGIRDYNLILAKINEIVVLKKDLYKEFEAKKTRG